MWVINSGPKGPCPFAHGYWNLFDQEDCLKLGGWPPTPLRDIPKLRVIGSSAPGIVDCVQLRHAAISCATALHDHIYGQGSIDVFATNTIYLNVIHSILGMRE